MLRLPALLVALLLATPALADGPFSDLGYDAATAKAKEAGKLLMLDFTASWCPPCKMMEKQTWPDQKVIDWVAAHAIAIQLDVDEEANKSLAQKFEVQAIPTVVFLRDGAELDRHTGFKSPGDFVTWGDAVAAGKSTTETRAAETAADGASDDPDRRRDAAQELVRQGKLDEALEQYLWVWKATRDVPRWMGVRHSFLLSDIADLAERHPPAKKALNDLLEAAQRNIEAVETITWLDWIEWTSLLEHTQQQARLVAWYDAHRGPEGAVLTNQLDAQVVPRVRRDVFAELVVRQRFADAGHAVGDPIAHAKTRLAQEATFLEAMNRMEDGPMKDALSQKAEQRQLEELAPLYGCAFATGQADVAHEVGQLVVGAIDTPGARIALVRAALDMSDTRDPQLTTLLDEAEAKGGDVADLRARLGVPAAK